VKIGHAQLTQGASSSVGSLARGQAMVKVGKFQPHGRSVYTRAPLRRERVDVLRGVPRPANGRPGSARRIGYLGNSPITLMKSSMAQAGRVWTWTTPSAVAQRRLVSATARAGLRYPSQPVRDFNRSPLSHNGGFAACAVR
jgi:hypothetical protein